MPADELTKTRTLFGDAPALAVDVFTGRLAGLVLAEYELELDAVGAPMPAEAADRSVPDRPDHPGWPELPILAEVTDDARFTGGALARTSAAELAQLLATYH